MDTHRINDLLSQAFPNDTVTVDGAGCSLNVTVVSSSFSGQNTIKRHRRVYAALGELMESIHALSIQALTPEETTGENS